MDDKKYNIVKVRDDKTPIKYLPSSETHGFELVDQENLDWCNGKYFSKSELRTHIEPWLTSLFQSEHLSLLVGSGLTTAVQYAACGSSNNGMGADKSFSVFSDSIAQAANNSAIRTGREKANIEDQIRVANELITGLSVLKDNPDFSEMVENLETLRSELNDILNCFANNISAIERSIALADFQKREMAFNKLVMFIMSFASRTGTRDRLNIFTTNYDRLLEAGADVAGLRLIDRFVGALSPVFRSSRIDVDMHYNPPGIRGEPRYLEGVARFTKLHGSLDWINVNNDIRRIDLPFGAESLKPFLEAAGLSTDYSSLMIYPNSAKDRETAEYPYVELFRDFAAALCRPNSTLVTYGYKLGHPSAEQRRNEEFAKIQSKRQAHRARNHICHDIGFQMTTGPSLVAEVTLNQAAYVYLVNAQGYQNYLRGGDFSYHGGYASQSPYRVRIPTSNHWYVIVDNGDDPITGITSSVKVKSA